MYPNLVLKNQFGEESNNAVIGGSNQIDVSFIVDSTNGNGLGLRSLKQNLPAFIKNIFMHTSATPLAGNPNPAAGYILVEFAKNFIQYVSGYAGFGSPLSGTPINVTAGLTPGQVYTIASVGTTTPAQWVALGLQANILPAPGASFTAITATVGVGTGVVEIPLATGSGIGSVEFVGDPNATLAPSDNTGGYLLLQCMAPTSSGSTVPKATAPIDGSVAGLRFVMA